MEPQSKQDEVMIDNTDTRRSIAYGCLFVGLLVLLLSDGGCSSRLVAQTFFGIGIGLSVAGIIAKEG